MQGDGAQQSPGHGACHHTHAETSAHEPEVASPIFPIGDVGDIGASNRTCGAGDAGHDASGVEDLARTSNTTHYRLKGGIRVSPLVSQRQSLRCTPHLRCTHAGPDGLSFTHLQLDSRRRVAI